MGFRRKTRPGRNRILDATLLALEAELLDPEGPFGDRPVVDLGIGARPWTTEELHAQLRVPVVGVEIEPDLVERAQEHVRPGLSFVVGSFDLPVRDVRLVRVMNVLRDGPPEDVPGHHATLGEAVCTGGLVVEGSSAPQGEVGTAHWLRKTPQGLVAEALVMWTDGSRGLAPFVFRDRLPRDLRGNPHHPIREILIEWTRAFSAEPTGPDRLTRAAGRIDADLTRVATPEGYAFRLGWGHAPINAVHSGANLG